MMERESKVPLNGDVRRETCDVLFDPSPSLRTGFWIGNLRIASRPPDIREENRRKEEDGLAHQGGDAEGEAEIH